LQALNHGTSINPYKGIAGRLPQLNKKEKALNGAGAD
jgi:hypothetical protein